MDAIILAGGTGNRLRPITDYVPKSLVPISNVSIIEWQVRYLIRHKISRIIICSGYLQDQIKNFVDVRNKFGISIVFSSESSPLGTGGAIKKAESQVRGNSAFVINGDVITNIDLGKLTRLPNSISAVSLRTKYGVLDIDGETVKAFNEKKEIPDTWMNAGVYHLSRDTMRAMPRRGNAESTIFPKMAKKGTLYVTKFPNAQWYSIDSHKDLTECESKIHSIIL